MSSQSSSSQQNSGNSDDINRPLDDFITRKRRVRRGRGLTRERGSRIAGRSAAQGRRSRLNRFRSGRSTRSGTTRRVSSSSSNSARRIIRPMIPVPVVPPQPQVVVLPVATTATNNRGRGRISLTKADKKRLSQQINSLARNSVNVAVNQAQPLPTQAPRPKRRVSRRAGAKPNNRVINLSGVAPMAPMMPMMMPPPMYPVAPMQPMAMPTGRLRRSVPRSQRRIGRRR